MKDISFGIWKRKSHKSFKICMRRSAEANIPHKKFFLYHGPKWCTRIDDWRCIGLWKKAPCLSDFLGWPQRSHRTSLWKVHEKQFLHLQAKWLLVSCGILMVIYIKTFWALIEIRWEALWTLLLMALIVFITISTLHWSLKVMIHLSIKRGQK